jgi:hypothetical protein
MNFKKNASQPLFNMNYYDNYGNSSMDYYQTRQIYLDIFTQPGAIYEPIKVEVAVPEIVNGSKYNNILFFENFKL